jgi:hypothetical protein
VKKWIIKERDDAEAFQGKRTKGSGNQWANRGDVKTPYYLIEDKTTDKKSYSITIETWKKIWEEAVLSKKIPILSIKFNKNGDELIVLSKNDFLNIVMTH